MSTRDRIVAAAAQLYGRYGYTGVGLKQVAAESGAPIGSLYHFFPGGKDELAAEALRLSGAGYQTLVEGILENMPDLASGIEQSFALAAEVLAAGGYLDACWIETVAHYIDNTVRFDDYTGGQNGFVTRGMIPVSWVVFTTAGLAGYRALRRSN